MTGVAPRAGAWIETGPCPGSRASNEVAPRAGAWIETLIEPNCMKSCEVAPRAGAWIETSRYGLVFPPPPRRAPRGRVD